MAFSSINTNPCTAATFPCKGQGILLANSNFNWIDNVYQEFNSGNISNAVFWANKIVGIRTNLSIKTVNTGTKIAVKGIIERNGWKEDAMLFGVINDVIIPYTDVQGLCQAYPSEKLGLGSDISMAHAVKTISNALSGTANPNLPCIGYDIEFKGGLFIADMLFNEATDDIIDKSLSEEWKEFLRKVIDTKPNKLGVYIC